MGRVAAAEQRFLSLAPILLMAAAVVENAVQSGHQPRAPREVVLPPARRQPVERAGLDERLEHLLVDQTQVHVLDQREERRDRAAERRAASRGSDVIAPCPAPLTAPRPNRTPSGSTTNGSSLRLMSGGSTGTPSSRHSSRYSAILSEFSDSIVSSAAMKWRGKLALR